MFHIIIKSQMTMFRKLSKRPKSVILIVTFLLGSTIFYLHTKQPSCQPDPSLSNHLLANPKARDIEKIKPTVYRVHFKPVHLAKNITAWQTDILHEIQTNFRWTLSQVEQLHAVLKRDLFNISNSSTSLSNRNHLCPWNHKFCQFQLTSSTPDKKFGPISIGKMPVDFLHQPAMKGTFKKNNPFYHLTGIYWKPARWNKSHPRIECPKTDIRRRRSLYKTLQNWIKLAAKHHIWWALTFGSLIGSLRDGNMIPYDKDLDIFVLGTDEPKIRQLAKDRNCIKSGTLNLITRPGKYCDVNPGDRIDCNGMRVTSIRDTCSFCGPLARIFMERENFIDIFLIHMELHTNASGFPTAFGYSMEDVHTGTLPELSMLVPLRTCRMMGLIVPCPHRAELLLEKVYGKHWRKPTQWCNGSTGQWEKSR